MPESCPLCRVLGDCVKFEPEERPTFDEICKTLQGQAMVGRARMSDAAASSSLCEVVVVGICSTACGERGFLSTVVVL